MLHAGVVMVAQIRHTSIETNIGEDVVNLNPGITPANFTEDQYDDLVRSPVPCLLACPVPVMFAPKLAMSLRTACMVV